LGEPASDPFILQFMQQARYWLLTIPQYAFTPYLPPGVQYIKGQLEEGQSGLGSWSCCQRPDCVCSEDTLRGLRDTVWNYPHYRHHSECKSREPLGYCNCESGYVHWQILVAFTRKLRLGGVCGIFGKFHAEPTRSAAANEYVWKDDTAIQGTRFQLGKLPMGRGNSTDWESVKSAARDGRLDDIAGDIYVRYYGNLKRIAVDNCQPVALEREIKVYWGPTGVGKSRAAWDEAGFEAYPKDPRTKFWDGYRGQSNVVMDEFRGDIGISHLLRWFDRYPVIVEIKGSSVVLKATKFWITSNLPPELWFPELDLATREALLRRLDVTHME